MTGKTAGESNARVISPGGIKELVRGQEQDLLAQLVPLVRRESVALDLGDVERIDAAGLSALIRLYCEAQRAGYAFTVTRTCRHVSEILRLVGLDRVLSGGEPESNWPDARMQENAA